MRLFRYTDFRKDDMINEDLNRAKKVLRDTYQQFKSVKSVSNEYETDPSGLFLFNKVGDNFRFEELPSDVQNQAKSKFRENNLTPDERQKAERSDVIKTIRELLGDKNLGYAYLFTYLMVIEKTPVEELQNIFDKLQEYKTLLNSKSIVDDKKLIRRPINSYIDPNIPNNAEQLADDLEDISLHKAVKKVYDEFTPDLKQEFKNQPPVIKKQIADVALAFTQLGMEDGKINDETQQKLWKLFFGEVKTLTQDIVIRGKSYKAGDKIYTGQMVRYKNIRDFIKSAQNYLKNIDNTETVKFYEQIEKCNDKYGDYGVKVMFDSENILILEILSFQANQFLNSHTRHCIKDSLYQWDHYVGGEDKNTKQYYIYNFNLPSYDTKSVIGITIGPEQSIRACHLKDDHGFSSGFKPLLKQWEKEYGIDEDLWRYFPPMSREEIERKRKRVLANREVVKKGKSLQELEKYLKEDGADVNAGNGAALHNAVEEASVEKVKFLLEFGASPNLRKKQEATVNRIEDIEDSEVAFEILKLLLTYGAELSRTVFKGLIGDLAAVKFCLENGLDPNFSNGVAIRLALKKGKYDVLMALIEGGAKVENSRGLNLAWAYEGENQDCVDFILKQDLDGNGISNSMNWLGHSNHLPAEKRLKILKDLQSMIDEGKLKPKESGYRLFNKDGMIKKRNATYQDVIDEYGSLYEYTVATNYNSLKSALD
jgi:hypothetical protein